MGDWERLETAPRDGSVIELTAIEDDGSLFEIHPMQWGHIQQNGIFAPGIIGMWVAPGGEYTWREGEGGPTHWRPYRRTTGDENE
jgi:hypothetical protein